MGAHITTILRGAAGFVLGVIVSVAVAQGNAADGPGFQDNLKPIPAPVLPPTPDASTEAAPVPGPAPGRAPTEAERPSGVAQPFRAGSFLLYPEVIAQGFYDSNVFYTNSNPLSDRAFVFAPAIWAQSDWREHALNFYAAADLTRYDTYTKENTNDWRVSGEGRYDINLDSSVYGGLRYSRDHEDRESPEGRNGLEPTVYYAGRAYAGWFRQFGKTSVRIAGTVLDLNYDDVPFLTGGGQIAIINNDDRDRNQYTAGVRVGYEVSPRAEPFVQVALDDRRYKYPDDLGQIPELPQYAGLERNSNGNRAVGGLRYNVPQVLKAEVYAGWLGQNYLDWRLADVSTPAFGMALQWQATDRLRLNAVVDRTVEETTVLQLTPTLVPASSFVNTYLLANAAYRASGRVTLRALGSASRVAYQGISRTDDYYSAGAGINFRFERRLFVDLSYLYRTLHSSVPFEDFKKYQVFLAFGMLIAP
jgi:hypothetical protein